MARKIGLFTQNGVKGVYRILKHNHNTLLVFSGNCQKMVKLHHRSYECITATISPMITLDYARQSQCTYSGVGLEYLAALAQSALG